MNSDGYNNLSLKYERYASYGSRDIGIRKLGLVAKTQFYFDQIFLKSEVNTFIPIYIF